MRKRFFSLLLTLSLCLSMLSAPAYAADSSSASRSGVSITRYLNATEQALYLQLEAAIQNTAAGLPNATLSLQPMEDKLTSNRSVNSTVYFIDASDLDITYDEQSQTLSGFDLEKLLAALLMNHPFELYWYSEDGGAGYSAWVEMADWFERSDSMHFLLAFYFSVSKDYAPRISDGYTTDPAKTGSGQVAAKAAEEAQRVVDAHKDESDYQKLVAYKEYIFDQVSYNHAATSQSYDSGYGDPWQLIYVFDKDPSTNVVCEGYAKAFQYLCNLSTFSDPTFACYIVTGMMSDRTGRDRHMWNVVTLGGQNYLVDVTNSDPDGGSTPSAEDEMFLAGTPDGSVAEGYTFHVTGNQLLYEYDPQYSAALNDHILVMNMVDLYTEAALTLAPSRYDPTTAATVSSTDTAASAVRTAADTDNSKTFADVPSDHWANDAVTFVTSHGIFNGTGESTFDPDGTMTRGMLAQVLFNLAGGQSSAQTTRFTDVAPSDWYAPAISWAVEQGIVTGYSDGTFSPESGITREQLAVMLWRFAGASAQTTNNHTLAFRDASQVSAYARDALLWATAQGILHGKGNGLLDPQGLATRAEVAQLLMNFLSAE